MPEVYEKERDALVKRGYSLKRAKSIAAATWNKRNPDNPNPWTREKKSKKNPYLKEKS